MKRLERIFLKDVICRKVELVGHWLGFGILEKLELIVLDVKNVLNQRKVSP
jgi:hypothetical protein